MILTKNFGLEKVPLTFGVKQIERNERDITPRLKDDWLIKTSQIKMDRRCYVKFLSKDIHSGHFTGEVSINKHLLISLYFKIAKLLFPSLKKCLVSKDSNFVSHRARWHNKKISIKGYSILRNFSRIESYKLLLHNSLFLYILEIMGLSEILKLSLFHLASHMFNC